MHPILPILTICLALLKIFKVIRISWLWVTYPIWGGFLWGVVVFIFISIIDMVFDDEN